MLHEFPAILLHCDICITIAVKNDCFSCLVLKDRVQYLLIYIYIRFWTFLRRFL